MIRRIYAVDPLTCVHCGAEMRVLSFPLDPPVIRRILDHLASPDEPTPATGRPG